MKAIKCKGKSAHETMVLDATAGYGIDSFVFASHNFSVILVERNKVLHALLKDGLKRALECDRGDVVEIAQRMKLINCIDAKTYLSANLDIADVM